MGEPSHTNDTTIWHALVKQWGEEKPHAEDTVCTEWLNAPFVWTAKAERLGFLRLCDVRFLQV